MNATEKARQMFDKVRDGQVLFTKAGDRWLIVGPTEQVQRGHKVTVTKTDGSTTQVYVSVLGKTVERQGVSYTVAEFLSAVETPQQRGYRTVHSSLYGEGRVYRVQPGATQYDDDGSGRFNVQIWDES